VPPGVCQPHDCISHSLAVAFDHEGHVWASLVCNNARTLFGNLNPLLRVQLTTDALSWRAGAPEGSFEPG
jgi:hypothetical protein